MEKPLNVLQIEILLKEKELERMKLKYQKSVNEMIKNETDLEKRYYIWKTYQTKTTSRFASFGGPLEKIIHNICGDWEMDVIIPIIDILDEKYGKIDSELLKEAKEQAIIENIEYCCNNG